MDTLKSAYSTRTSSYSNLILACSNVSCHSLTCGVLTVAVPEFFTLPQTTVVHLRRVAYMEFHMIQANSVNG